MSTPPNFFKNRLHVGSTSPELVKRIIGLDEQREEDQELKLSRMNEIQKIMKDAFTTLHPAPLGKQPVLSGLESKIEEVIEQNEDEIRRLKTFLQNIKRINQQRESNELLATVSSILGKIDLLFNLNFPMEEGRASSDEFFLGKLKNALAQMEALVDVNVISDDEALGEKDMSDIMTHKVIERRVFHCASALFDLTFPLEGETPKIIDSLNELNAKLDALVQVQTNHSTKP